MTGFGRAEQIIGEKTFLIEIKSLNGKQFDIRLQIPPLLRPLEFDIRSILNEQLERGSVECIISMKQNGSAKPVVINTELLKAYYESVIKVASELNADTSQLLASILRLPEVVANTTDSLNEEESAEFKKLLVTAVKNVDAHRKDEGTALETELLERVGNIEILQNKVSELEPNRRIRIKENLQKLLEDKVGKENYDNNRLEQELIYYIEKIDITEERVRLMNHCDYFRNILTDKDKSKGKKLSFILQEFGREINTTGSKANDADIQKCVVLMKDELEKAKEQVLNVL